MSPKYCSVQRKTCPKHKAWRSLSPGGVFDQTDIILLIFFTGGSDDFHQGRHSLGTGCNADCIEQSVKDMATEI